MLLPGIHEQHASFRDIFDRDLVQQDLDRVSLNANRFDDHRCHAFDKLPLLLDRPPRHDVNMNNRQLRTPA